MFSLKFFVLPFALVPLPFLVSAPAGMPQDLSQAPRSSTTRSQVAGYSTSGSIDGTVTFADTQQIHPQVMVTIRSTTSGLSRNVLTDSSGHFEFSDVPDGDYIVSVDENGYKPTTASAFVDGAHDDVSLNLRSSNSGNFGARGPTVSVNELKIPVKARDLFEKGLHHLNREDYAASLPFFKKAIANFPDYYEAYYHLGVAQAHLAQTDSAAGSFQSAINLSGGHYPWAEFGYALILTQRGDIADAERLARDGLEQDQSTPDGYVVMAVIQLHQHQIDDAEKNAREALARNSHHANAYLVLADVHGSRKEYAEEVKDLDTYLTLYPNSPKAQLAQDLRQTAQRLATENAAKQANP
jgi:predicted Zn-dependent protease